MDNEYEEYDGLWCLENRQHTPAEIYSNIEIATPDSVVGMFLISAWSIINDCTSKIQ